VKAKTSSSKALALASDAADLPVIAASLVHEVKNPLAAIHLHLQLLEAYTAEIEEEKLRSKINNKIAFIKNEIAGLNTTLQDFIRRLKPEEPGAGSSASINQIVRESVMLLEVQARKRNIELEIKEDLPAETQCADPVMLKQVLINLVLNAIQAFEHRPDIEAPHISVITGQVRKVAYVRIKDNGPGIPAEIQEKIFDPFFTTKKEGSGLGLSIVKKMILDAGGQIDLESGKEGTDFTIYLGRPDVLADATR
jgi:two-component system nitrogen regulation sensor histidine kinase GlnL